jgi:hypothetical protein
MAGIAAYVVLVVSIANAPQYLPVAPRIGCSRTASLAPMVAIHGYWNRDRVDYHKESLSF